jgi:hypothetical protein
MQFVVQVIGEFIFWPLLRLLVAVVTTVRWLALLPVRMIRWLVLRWPTAGPQPPPPIVRRRSQS